MFFGSSDARHRLPWFNEITRNAIINRLEIEMLKILGAIGTISMSSALIVFYVLFSWFLKVGFSS